MNHADIVARMLIMNGQAQPHEYRAIVDYYENRGFFLVFDQTGYTTQNGAVVIVKKTKSEEE